MALSTVGKHYTPVLQRIQEAIDSNHVRSMPSSVWQGAVARAGPQECRYKRARARAAARTPPNLPLARGRADAARPQRGSFGSGPPAGTSISNALALKASRA